MTNAIRRKNRAYKNQREASTNRSYFTYEGGKKNEGKKGRRQKRNSMSKKKNRQTSGWEELEGESGRGPKAIV